ncbi:MAG TPA: hypothetical protein VKF63_12320 [Terracidiphilus sp.]|nr:hypothetical protein [Terracidiphilus sp.]
MSEAHSQTQISYNRRVDAVKTNAVVYGVYAGILGMEHGFLEILQGNAAPRGVRIMAAGGTGLPFPFGHEPAMTVIPNFLATGIAATTVGMAIILWCAAISRRKHRTLVLLLLSVALLLVGGGFGPISLLIAACIAASGIGRPHTRWRRLRGTTMRLIAALWPWSLGAAIAWVPIEVVLGQMLHLKNDSNQTLTNLNFLFSYPLLFFVATSLFAGFAHKAHSLREEEDAGVECRDDRA